MPRTLLRFLLRFPIKEILVSSITSLLIVGIAGYKLTNYLSKDRISIERVDIIPETTQLSYPTKEMMELYHNPRFENYYMARGSSTISQFNPGFYNRTFRTLQKQSIDEIIRVLEDFSKVDGELQLREDDALQKLENYNQGDNVNFIISNIKYSKLGIYAVHSINQESEKVKATIDFIKKDKMHIMSAHQIKDNILMNLRSFTPERTGLIKIKLVLLNSGDTDGLVKAEGNLNMSGLNIPLKIPENVRSDDGSLYERDPFQTVPKRSVAQKIFIINESESAQSSLNELKSTVKLGHATPVTITLRDIRDDPISKAHKLPIIQK
jgi:hypothetical protein